MPTEILMPALSPTMEEGTLAKWHVKEGDEVRTGDVIAEIETDKATMEVEAIDDGRIGKILVSEGAENVPVNKPIAILLADGEDAESIQKEKDQTRVDQPKSEPKADKSSKDAPQPKKKTVKPAGKDTEEQTQRYDGKRIFASPLARRIARQQSVDLSTVKGSGPHGRIVKADVEGLSGSRDEQADKEKQPDVARSAIDARAFYAKDTYEEVKLDGMRRTIARRLTQSMQEIPHFYLTIDCKLDELLAARKKLNEIAGEGVKLSVNDFVIRAAALALTKVPDANVSFAGDALLKHKSADIGIAVALDGGLITPIVRNAHKKGLAEISEEVKTLAEKARTRKLKPSEYEGGTFSISNLGMYGVKEFTAVINPPQAAILAVGKGEERAVVRNGKLEVATVMTVTLSCDHRAIDGALGAQLLEAFKQFIEYPARMLL